MRRDNRAEKVHKKRRRRKKRYLLRFLLLILLCVGIYFGVHIDYFKVDGIAVVGNEEISDEEILKLSELEVGENLFDVHPLFAQHRIKENLYIEKVRVKRKLPNKIEISVTERSGKAQFQMGKRFVITDNEGMVLAIEKEQQKVPLVENIKVTKAKKKKTIEVKQTATYDKAMEIVQKMEENAEGGLAYSGKCYICQSECMDDAKAVAMLVESRFPNLNGKVEIYPIGATIGSHTGPGTVALFFWGKERVD